jgi:hypothetical protein
MEKSGAGIGLGEKKFSQDDGLAELADSSVSAGFFTCMPIIP